ncbi:hypothetical protein ABH935_009933 [Catenulispora sp. GAS73]|uniref:hypothetical protein n=1 Tax=Catenulispora sp. GAS73 TaxID=3156269 RepID=UPI003514FA5F
MSSEFEFDGRPLPVNLHFRDERVLTVDIDAIMSSGRRMRHNRKALAGAGVVAAIGVLGVSAAYLAPTSASSAAVVGAAPSPGRQQPSTALNYLAGGGHVTVLGSRVNAQAGFTLSAVAWRAGPSICSGIANLVATTTSSSITCANRPSTLSATRPTVLAPHLVTGVTDDMGAQVAIGFVSGDVAEVSLKVRGQLCDATVVALPGSPSTGAYVVWIGPGDSVATAQDFTQIIGYDSRGAIVTG